MSSIRLIVTQNQGQCSACKNVYFDLYNDRFWQRPAEAIFILQKQFNIHLQTVHKMVNDSLHHEKT